MNSSKVESREDFLIFLNYFVKDISKNDFENNDFSSFFEAFGSWVESMDGYYENIGEKEVLKEVLNNKISWRILADALMAARVYE